MPTPPPTPTRSNAVKLLCEQVLDPRHVGGILDNLVYSLEDIRKQTPYSSLCFVQNEEGLPAGTVKLASALVGSLGVPANLWTPKGSIIQGVVPGPEDRLVIISDIFVKGNTFKKAVEDIQRRYGSTTVHCLVVYNLSPEKTGTLKIGNITIQVREVHPRQVAVEAAAKSTEMESHMQKMPRAADGLLVEPLRPPNEGMESTKEASMQKAIQWVSKHLAATMVLLPLTCYLALLVFSYLGLVSESSVAGVRLFISALSR